MKKTTSGIVYVLFFIILTAVFTCCTIYFINLGRTTIIDNKSTSPDTINAVNIDGDDTGLSYRTVMLKDFSESPYYKPIKTTKGRESLSSESEKKLYDLITKSVTIISETKDENDHYRTERVNIEGIHMSESEIRRSINAFVFDNPHIFWLDNLFGYAYVGEDTMVEFYSVISADECEKKYLVLNSAVNRIMASLEDGMSEFEREKFMHDFVINNCIYKGTVASLSDGWEYFSAYGSIVKGEAVCEGYAKSMQLLLNLSGIECMTIRGDSEGVGHMWNVVKIDDEWYHLDSTWDDTTNGAIYDFFNIDDEMIKTSHTISPIVDEVSLDQSKENDLRYNFFIPKCTSTQAGYYSKNAAVITTFDEETNNKVISALINAANSKEKYLPIMFGKEMQYEEYINTLFFNQPYKFYSYVNSANEQLDDEHKIDRDGLSIVKNENASLVRVVLAYTSDSEES